MKRPKPKVERVSLDADPDAASTEAYTLSGDSPSSVTEVMDPAPPVAALAPTPARRPAPPDLEDPEAKTLELAASAGVVWEDTGDIQAFQKAAAAAHAALAAGRPPAPPPAPNPWTAVLGVVQILFAGAMMTGGMALLLFLTRGST